MTDLSYTNKDGLNPAAGFTNVYNYHRDGSSSAHGYEHGGYPEVTGETSPYTDTSYKTGDAADHWGNGNTFDIIPGTPTLVSIAITTPPTKTEYLIDGFPSGTHTNVNLSWIFETFKSDSLDLTGMVVTGTYSDGSEAVILDYETSPAQDAVLTAEDTEVTITFEGQTTTQALTLDVVNHVQMNGDDGNDPARNYTLYEWEVGTWGIQALWNMNINIDFDDSQPIEGENIPFYPQGACIECYEDPMRFVTPDGTVFDIPDWNNGEIEYVITIPNTDCTYPVESAYIILHRVL